MSKRARKRWLYGVCIGVGLVLVGAVVGYFVVTSKIRSQLARLVSDNFGAELKEASVSYLPPYGAVVRDVRIVTPGRDGRERDLLRVARVDVRLDRAPGGDGPVVIQELVLKDPVVNLVSNEPCPPGVAICPPEPPVLPIKKSGKPPKPGKLSDKVQIRHLKVEGGSVRYEDRSRPDVPPLVVGGLRLEVRPPQEGGGGGPQPFELSADGEGARVAANGSIHLDDLVLAVANLTADVRLGAGGGATTPFPPHVADALRRYRLSGRVNVAGHAELPLRAIGRGSYDATVQVSDATAGPADSDLTFSGINVQLACDNAPMPADTRAAPAAAPNQPAAATRPAIATTAPTPFPPAGGPALHVRLARAEARCGDARWRIDGGEFWRDPGKGVWKLARLAGTVETPRPGEPGRSAGKSDKRPSGRIDFTGAAGGPLVIPPGREAMEVAKYELVAVPRDAVVRPGSKWPLPIEQINGVGLRAADGVVTFSDMTGVYGGDRVFLRTARIPIPKKLRDLRVETPVEEIAGTLICRQPGPEYPPGLRNVFKALRPEGEFAVAGRLTLRHRPGPGLPKPRDDFNLDVVSDGKGSFAVTDRRIPLAHVRGRAMINNMMIAIGPAEARSLGGTVTAEVMITPKSRDLPTQYEGRGWVRDVDMAALGKVLGAGDGQVARKLTGRGHLNVQFGGLGAGSREPPLRTLRAEGEAQVTGGHFWDDPVLGPVAAEVKRNGNGLGDAAAIGSIADGRVTIRQAAINSPSVGIEGRGTIGFDKRLDLQIVAVPIGDLKDKLKQSGVPILGDVAGEVVGVVQVLFKGATQTLLYAYRVTGTTDRPSHAVVPAPVLSDPAAFIFGEMLKANGDAKLLEAVRARADPPRR